MRVQDWANGRLYPWLRLKYGDKSEAELDRDFGRLIEGRELPNFVRYFDGFGDCRRWCWCESWLAYEQDEEILLMSDGWVDDMLIELVNGCPQREYIYSIVVHHMRDSAHNALKTGLRERLRAISGWKEKFQYLFGLDTSYPLRLLGYSAPSKVSKDEAIQRVYDLRCCSPNYGAVPELKTHKKGWTCLISSMYDDRERYILINRKDGEMSLL